MPISVGSVEVDVIPNTRGIYQRLRDALVPAGTRAGRDAGDAAGRAFAPAMASSINGSALDAVGRRIGQQIATRISAQIRSSLSQGITQGGAAARPAATRQGDETGGAFGRAMKARLEAAFRSMPRLNVGLNDTGVDADLARLRARLETLSNKRIGIDVDAATADAEVADISERLRRLGAAHPSIAVRADTAAARAQLDAMREEIARLSADPLRIRVETDGSFGQRLRAQVQAAQASLPNINIGADTSPAQAELASLRAQLGALSDQRVGIDIDAATASARIDEIRARLRLLGVTATDISVRVDAATAEAQLAQVEAMADAVDGKNINLHVSNGEALSAIFQVAVAIAALAAIPAIPVLVAGTGSVVAAFTAAGVGVGALAAAALPAFSQIKGALDAQKQAQDAASTATAKGGQTAAQAASRALQMAGAQSALASAERNAAQQIASAQRQVAQAKRGVADAVEQAAQRQEQAERAVVQAERQVVQAARATAQAEAALAQTQKDAKQAQLDLTSARRTAAEQLVDLNNQLVDAQLAQERAVIAVRAAQKQLDADRLAGASSARIADDVLNLKEAKQALVEQGIQTTRLQEQTKTANVAGVEGSATVKQAQDAIAQSQQKVVDQTQAVADAQQGLRDAQQSVADAQKAQTRTQVQNARAISDAQAKVADAVRNVANAQASAAESIASAQRQVQSASLSAAGATDASATAAEKYGKALAKLSPSARGTFNAFVSLRTAFKAWSLSLQPAIMPIFTRALNGIKNSLPGLTPLVLGAASGIGKLQDKISSGFKSPWWKEIKKDFARSVEPSILRVGRIFGNVFVGMTGIVDAFLPHLGGVSDRSDGITKKFANFGKNLRGNPKFERFIGYAAEQAPKLGDAFGRIATAFLDVSKAIAPLSGPLLVIIGGLASGVSAIATDAPGALQLLYGIFVATKLVTLAQLALNGVMVAYRAGVVLVTLLTQGWAAAQLEADAAFAANPIVAIILIIIVTIGLLVAAILYAWNHWAWFRDAVKAVWSAIAKAAEATTGWFKNSFIPFFTKTIPGAFAFLLGWVRSHWPLLLGILTGPFGLAVWAILHYWSQISGGLWSGWSWIKKNVLYPIRDFFTKTIPGWAGSMKNSVVTAFKNMGSGVASAWGKLEDAAKKPINFVIGTVWNKGILGVWNKITGWIPGLPKMGKLPLLAQGGTLPVQPGVFNRPTAIVGEGNRAHPEYVIPTDPKYRGRALALLQQAGSQMLAGGGIIGSIGDVASSVGGAVSDAASGAWKGIKSAADFVKDPVGNLLKLLNPIMNKLRPLTSPWGKVAAGLPKAAINGLKHLVGVGGSSTGGGKIPSGEHGQIISQALAAAHVPPPGTLMQWLTGMNTLIQRESGWNPNSINLWDSNAKAGHPSGGLAQTISSTWAHYVPAALKGRGMLDPVGNVAAAIRYIVSRYGNITNVQQANASLPPKGYDSGGFLAPGLNLAYNGTGRPEPVFTSQQAASLVRLATAPAAAGGGEFTGDLYLDSGEFLGKVRGEVQQGLTALASSLRAGRKG